ncbi:CyP450 monooxygenase [Salix suchowensis]|nr:CyP450 monooxygenase [Salix suchowensis]
MDVSYGVRVLEKGDLHTLTAEEAFSSLNAATVPGAFLVDLFSVLKYIPSLIPGTGFKRLQNMLRRRSKYQGLHGPSLLFGHGHVPEVQKKARTELDAVIDGRLPTFEDRPQLPSIQAIVQEAMRWQQVTLLGAAHFGVPFRADGNISRLTHIPIYSWYLDIYVVGVADPYSLVPFRSILHDPVMYPKPFDFNPDRFLKDGEINPEARHPNQASFGFGRRDGSVYIIVASTLSVFSIQPPLDEQGNPIALEAVMIKGLLS